MPANGALFLAHPDLSSSLREWVMRDAEFFARRCRSANLSITTDFAQAGLPLQRRRFQPKCYIGSSLRMDFPSDGAYYEALLRNTREVYAFADGANPNQRGLGHSAYRPRGLHA